MVEDHQRRRQTVAHVDRGLMNTIIDDKLGQVVVGGIAIHYFYRAVQFLAK
jgi:hypothetical protein